MSIRFSLLAFFFLTLLSLPPVVSAKTKEAEIHLYPSYATSQGLLVTGQVLRFSKTIQDSRDNPSGGRTFRSMFRRFTRKSIPNARVFLQIGVVSKTVLADSYGFFEASFPSILPPSPASSPSSQPTSLPSAPTTELPKSFPVPRRSVVWPVWGQVPEATPGFLPIAVLLLPSQGSPPPSPAPSSFAVFPASDRGVSVVTDLDDTLIETNVTQKLKMIRTVFFRSPAEIVVIPGALDFLRSLLEGSDKQGGGTLHYVSGSPLSLFDRIATLFALRGFPLGSLTLKKISGTKAYPLKEQIRYKVEQIRDILQAYPQRSFVFVGDSGEKDPLIYYRLRMQFPRQVRAIYIRQVQDKLPPQAQYPGIFYFKAYSEAAEHARKDGLIR